MQSLHELTCTESPVAKFKAKVPPPKTDKMNAWLFGLKNKVAFLRKNFMTVAQASHSTVFKF